MRAASEWTKRTILEKGFQVFFDEFTVLRKGFIWTQELEFP
jgi:hypothetical protein